MQRLFGRTLTPRWRYGLWLMVLARLVTPVLPSVRMGAPELDLPRWTAEAPTPTDSMPLASSGFPRPRPARSPIERLEIGAEQKGELEDAAPTGVAVARMSRDASSSPGRLAEPKRRVRPGLSTGSVASAAVERPSAKALTVVLWLVVAAALAARAVFRALRFHRRLAHALRPEDPRLLVLLEECRKVMRVRRPVALLETEAVTSPAVTGLWHPTLLLPPKVTERLSEAELRHVFLHELAHLRRCDLPLALVVMALESLYWFHPLVRMAIRRLRTAQESARDWEALAVHPSPAPLSYARTLLKLCEGRAPSPAPVGLVSDFTDGGRDLERRILMITEYRASSHRAALVGVVLTAALAWAGFTSAAQPALPAGDSQPAGQSLATISVEHHQDAPVWLAPLQAALDRPISMQAEGTSAREVFAYLRQVAGVNLVVDTVWLDDIGDPDLEFEVTDTPLGEVLDLVCSELDGRHCLAREAIYVCEDLYLAEGTELRFYKLAPFYERGLGEEEDEVLCELVQRFAADGSWTWDWPGVSIETWNGLLIVSQTREMHAHIESFLNRFLNRGAEQPSETPAWRVRLEEVLAAQAEISVQGIPLTEVAQVLAERYGVPILVSEDIDEEDVDLHLTGVSLRTVLEWLGASQGLKPHIHGGVVELIQGEPHMSLEYHELGGLFEAANHDDADELRDTLEDMIRNRIDPDTWDYEHAALLYVGDLLLVRNTASAQLQIAQLIQTLERAFSD